MHKIEEGFRFLFRNFNVAELAKEGYYNTCISTPVKRVLNQTSKKEFEHILKEEPQNDIETSG